MSGPRFEIYPAPPRPAEAVDENLAWLGLPGDYCWRFRDSNGSTTRITFTGARAFARRDDARQAVIRAVADSLVAAGFFFATTDISLGALGERVPIIDLDENGDVIEAEGKA